jgi:hypothetical protein
MLSISCQQLVKFPRDRSLGSGFEVAPSGLLDPVFTRPEPGCCTSSTIYLKLITPNRPFLYPFGPAVKNSWLGLPFIPPP